MPPFRARVNLEAMAMKGYSAFPKPPDCLVSYPGHSLWESYSSAEGQSVYSTTPTDWAMSLSFILTSLSFILFLVFFLIYFFYHSFCGYYFAKFRNLVFITEQRNAKVLIFPSILCSDEVRVVINLQMILTSGILTTYSCYNDNSIIYGHPLNIVKIDSRLLLRHFTARRQLYRGNTYRHFSHL